MLSFLLAVSALLIIATVFAMLIGKALAWISDSDAMFFKEQTNLATYTLNLFLFNITFFLLAITAIFFIENIWLTKHIRMYDIVLHCTSYITSCNWQVDPVNIFSHFSINIVILPLEFIGAITGICMVIMFIKAAHSNFHNLEIEFLNSFYDDFLKVLLILMLPMAFILSLVLQYLGIIQINADYFPYLDIAEQQRTLATGLVATFQAISLFGVNGGGYFAANAGDPVANPSVLSSFIQVGSMYVIPASLCFYLVFNGLKKQGIIAFCTMCILLLLSIVLNVIVLPQELPMLENRLGSLTSILYNTVASATSGASVLGNEMFSNLNESLFVVNILLTGNMFGTIGAGFMNFMTCLILTLFVIGLLSGRSQTFMQKEINAMDLKIIMLFYVKVFAIIIFGSMVYAYNTAGLNSQAIARSLYMFASTFTNNGSGIYEESFNSDGAKIVMTLNIAAGRFIMIALTYFLSRNMILKNVLEDRFLHYENHYGTIIMVLFVIASMYLVYLPFILLGSLIR